MAEWEYWTVEIQASTNMADVVKQALAEGGRFGYELVSVTPITSSQWGEQQFSIGGPSAGVSVHTSSLIMIFKRTKQAASQSAPAANGG